MIEDRTIACPTAESIRHYAAGGFDEQRAEELENHLLSCPHCETLLDGLDDPSDAIIQALTTLPMSADDEAAYQQCRQAALAQSAEFIDTHDAATHLQLAQRLADPELGPLPCMLGNYELLACIGRGASGAVYRARHLKLEQVSAVKVLDTSRSIDPDAFLQEMKTIGSLAHPNIVRATDAGEVNGHHFLVMEYVDGIDAARLLFRNGPLRIADACEIVRQAALGLQFIHEQSLIHRDIKPSNLLVTVDGHVKILDLGIATRLDNQHVHDHGHARPQGTFDYMAPEVWTNPSAIDSRSDQYSLGCTLHKLLTGKPISTAGILDSGSLSQVPRSLHRLLQKMLSADPEYRPHSMQAVIEVLAPFCRGANLPALIAKTSPQLAALVPTEKTHTSSNRRRITRRAALAGAASLGAVAFLFPKLKYLFFPSLERVVWRPLKPVEPKIFLAVGDPALASYETQKVNHFDLSADELTLLNMARPVNGMFSLSVDIDPRESPSCGVFFGGQIDYSKPNRSMQFQSVELLHVHGEKPDDREHHLLWSRWESHEEDDKVQTSRTPLAEVVVDLAENSLVQHLEVTCGRQGMPEISWNGKPVHESRWNLSVEGHALQRLSASLLPTAYLGRIGLISTNGTTTFVKPRLSYL